jgi:hypothetical protein
MIGEFTDPNSPSARLWKRELEDERPDDPLPSA